MVLTRIDNTGRLKFIQNEMSNDHSVSVQLNFDFLYNSNEYSGLIKEIIDLWFFENKINALELFRLLDYLKNINMSTPNKYLLARTLAGLTQEELAKKAHLSDKTILTLEKGGKMSRNTLEKIEKVLGEELKKVESIK